MTEEMNNFTAFVDVVGFIHREKFICKEIAMVCGDFKYHAIIKAPFSFDKFRADDREMAQWEIQHLHGLEYESGNVHKLDVARDIGHLLLQKNIIMENEYKIWCLKDMFRCLVFDLSCSTIDAEGIDLELQTEEPYPTCNNHTRILGPACECALATAYRLKDIYTNNQKLSNFINDFSEKCII